MNSSPLIYTVGGASFGKCNVQNQRLFSVNAGISGEEALQHASLLLNCVNELSFLGAMDDGDESIRWASHYLSEMAKAIIDDVTLGLQLEHENVCDSLHTQSPSLDVSQG